MLSNTLRRWAWMVCETEAGPRISSSTVSETKKKRGKKSYADSYAGASTLRPDARPSCRVPRRGREDGADEQHVEHRLQDRRRADVEEALELVVGGIFTGCNEGLGGVSKGFGYGVNLFRAYGVTPGFGRWEETRMGFFYPAAPASRKRCEYGVGVILLGEDLAYWCNCLVAVFANGNAELIKAVFQRLVALALVNAVLLVKVQRCHPVLFAVALEFAKAVVEAFCLNKGQRYPQLGQLFGQGVGVGDDELHPGRRPIVFLPLVRGENKTGSHLFAAFAGGCEGGVVGNPEIVSEPDQLCHP